MRNCKHSKNIFQEAIDHCRWKTVLYDLLENINILNYKNKNFEEIILNIYDICSNIKGLGILTIYDISSSICRYYNINIDKVYIIGNGPKRAIKLLNIKTKIQNFGGKLNIKYVDINDIILAFDNKGYKMDSNIRNNKNGDILESYICNWQKTINDV